MDKAVELLRDLVADINECNEPGMLDGYLDFLSKHNEVLQELGIDTIKEMYGYDE